MSIKGHVFILSGPSGVGKTTFQLKLLERLPKGSITMIPRYTNRPKRNGEIAGFEYNFTSYKGILQKLFANDFIYIEKWGDFYQAIETSSIIETIEDGRIGIVLASTFGAARLQREFYDNVTCLYMWTGNRISLRDPDCLDSEFPETRELKNRIRRKKLEDGFSEFETESLESERFVDKRMIDNNLDIAAINGRLRGREKVTILPNLSNSLDKTVSDFLKIVNSTSDCALRSNDTPNEGASF